MKYLKRNKNIYKSVVDKRGFLQNKQCNKHGDHSWKFTKEGFQWLLNNRDKMNIWVDEQRKLERETFH